ncbi:hypothetical protein GDO78_011293 [Eleutherodactylus coqui]|uniref:Coiled-coil domain containing 84 n=1 Tax=Eleutherodactylus coqui TaxID=57060 RepID=A0A8J6K7C8_ELECQ|nr:hypothetical protein GDO78_011293 [Eleutherodactylus coqui]
MAPYECSVCRRTVFSSRKKHVYEKGHRQRLESVLGAFGEKVAAARKMIKAASVVKFDPREHEQKFWCHCCQEEVQRHTSDGNVAVVFGGMLAHLYRFKSSVTKALENYEETEDALIKQVAGQIREAEQSRMEMLRTILEPGAPPAGGDDGVRSSSQQPPGRIISPADSEGPGPSNRQTLPHEAFVMAGAPPLTFIGQQVASDKGNVHTGALPPWMSPDEDDAGDPQDIGPSIEDFLKHKEKMALKKLPPNRVGANFDHSAPTDEGWLPSFGRVWNSGRRWQSRHQYKKEAGTKGGKRKRMEPP